MEFILGPVVPSIRALSGRPKFTVRRYKLNKDSLPSGRGVRGLGRALEEEGAEPRASFHRPALDRLDHLRRARPVPVQ